MKFLVWNGRELSAREKDEITLEDEQEIVGGWIELLPLGTLDDNGIQAFCNDEGKLMGLAPTALLGTEEDGFFKPYDFVAGNIMFAGFDEDGETIGLTDEQIELIRGMFVKVVPFHGRVLPALLY